MSTVNEPAIMGFLTDATICIGCKACEVACKQWNQLPADEQLEPFTLTGFSYDNTVDLGAETWRHVAFIEQERGRGRCLAHGQRRLQALDACRLHGCVPDRRDHPHRVRHRRHPGQRLQWLWLLCPSLSLWGAATQPQ